MNKVLACTMAQYTDDPCSIPSLNQSTATTLLQKSAAHAFMLHPKLGGMKKKVTKEMDHGTLVHKLLLGVGHEIVIISADNWRTNVAKEARDEARNDGRIPILQKEFDDALIAVERIKEHLANLDIDLETESQNELKIQFKSDGVLCRRALDSWHEETIQIRELKTIFCAHPSSCATQSLRMGYDIEYAVSIDAIQNLYPDYAGRIDFIFIFCELEEPFAVYACRPDGVFSHLGFQKWDRAKAIWKECLKSNQWPAYSENIGSLSAPMWAVKQLMEEGYEFTTESL